MTRAILNTQNQNLVSSIFENKWKNISELLNKQILNKRLKKYLQSA